MKRLVQSSGLLLALLTGDPAPAATAIIRDGSVGPGASVQPVVDAGVVEIGEDQGLRPGGGVNLLHSFAEFSIGAGDTALFTAVSGLPTERVISRVTGAAVSQIDGTLASAIPGADLFLLNPAGILFGPEASLDTQGGFHATTAATLTLIDEDPSGALTFTDDVRLAFAEPRSFGFLGTRASVTITGATLAVPDGTVLSLSGADVTLAPGTRLTSAGSIQLAAVGDAGAVPLTFGSGSTAGDGVLQVQGALLEATGDRAGTLRLTGGDVRLNAATLNADLSAGGTADAGSAIAVAAASSVELKASALRVLTAGGRQTGAIEVSGDRVVLGAGSVLETGPCDGCEGGAGGHIVIDAADRVTLARNPSGSNVIVSTSTGSDRDAGDISISAGNGISLDGGVIRSFTLAAGAAGSVSLAAPVIEAANGTLILSASGTPEAGGGGGDGGGGGGDGGGDGGGGSGDGGDGGGGSGGGGDGGGGDGGGGDGGGGDGGGSGGDGGGGGGGGGSGGGSGSGATGAGGNVVLSADQRITLRQDVDVAAVSNAAGDAGDVVFTAPVVAILNGTRIASAAAASGDAGRVRIDAAERVELSGTNRPDDPARDRGSRITASSAFTATGDAGSIDIDTGELILADGARLSSSTSGFGAGGSIRVAAGERVFITGTRGDGSGSSIRAAAEVEEDEGGGDSARRRGAAGDISIATPLLQMGPGAEIRSDTSLPGAGGLIQLDVGRLEMTGGLIEASSVGSGSGDAGDVLIGTGIGQESVQYPLQDVVLVDSLVETSADDAGGGDIVLRGSGSLRLFDSGIDASDTASDGGNVDVRSDADILVLDGSRILARAGQPGGDGGVIRLTTDAFLKSVDSLVVAENEVIINSPETNVEADLTELPDDFQDPGRLFSPVCAARSGADVLGRFTVETHPGLPPSPAEVQPAWISRLTGSSWRAAADELRRRIPQQAASAADEGAVLALAEAMLLAGSFDQALDLARSLEGNAGALGVAGAAATALGDLNEAERYFTEATRLTADDADVAATVMINWGNLAWIEGDAAAAAGRYAQAATLAAQAGLRLRERQALAAALAVSSGDAGLPRIDELGVAGAHGDSLQWAWHRIHLAQALLARHAAAPGPELRRVALRELTQARDAAQDAGHRQLLAHAYAALGRLYAADGRIEDALELTRVALRQGEGSAGEGRYAWFRQQGQLLGRLGFADEATAARRRAVAELEAERPVTRWRYGPAQITFRDLYLDLVRDLLESSQSMADGQPLLAEARATVERFKQTELRNFFHDECVAALDSAATALDDVDPRTAIVYPVLLEDRLELLVSRGGTIRRYTVAVPAATVAAEARALRRDLENRTTNEFLPHAQRLYQMLVQPYLEDVSGEAVTTLVFVPDGALHGIPMGVLHDGSSFMVERFAVAVTPGLTLTAPAPLDVQGSTALLAGVSNPGGNYDELANVPRELEAISSLFQSDVLLDAAFDAEAFRAGVVEGAPDIVHIASHASFGGSSNSSFLLTHDGALTIDDLHHLVAQSRFRKPLELLTLSACETAAGDERSALGLSGSAIRAGARSALGTLWTVSDAASQALVVDFYRRISVDGVSKAQALQEAQQGLIADARYAHPYYWSAFLLISNWL